RRKDQPRPITGGLTFKAITAPNGANIAGDLTDFYVEVFTASPAGLMIAVHHGFRGFNYQIVDVMRPATDVAVEKVAA
ncbi:hypothetical protein J2X48_004530, partial [Bosea sp. BE271]|uniref:hypothetical protein n=1 Tax=Bosea TaxID=85413 RepID=UPI00285FBCEC